MCMFFEKIHKTFKGIKFTKKGSINLMSRFFAMREMSLVCVLLVSLLEAPVFSEELKTYHSNGKLDKLEKFKNGKRDGINKKFFPNGKLVGAWMYRDGHLEGISKIFCYTKFFNCFNVIFSSISKISIPKVIFKFI